MRKTTLMLLVLFIACHWSLDAQNAKLKKAQHLMESLHYQEAINIYQQILQRTEHQEAITNLAIAYKKINDLENAILWFEKAVQFESVKPEVFYYYGQVLQHNGACEQAKPFYEKYLKLRPYDLRREQIAEPCKELKPLLAKESSSIYEVKPLSINGPMDDLGPAFYQNGLVFGAIKAENNRKKKAFFDLYFAPYEGGDVFSFQTAEQFSSELNSKLHEAIVTFNQEENEVYITRNRQEELDPRRNPVVRLEILSSHKQEDGTWSELQALPFNDRSYSVAHPCLSSDAERLFFSSDLPGGFGGKDIYLSFWEGERWGNPINLGPGINTEGDELFPFYHEAGQLYFSSDGHFGLGGQDIYMVNERGNGQWTKAENLGAPINTNQDDFGIIIDPKGEYGYFTSNRSGGEGGDDIYGIKIEEPRKSQAYRFKIVDGVSQMPVKDLIVLYNNSKPLEADLDGTFNLNIIEDDCFSLFISGDGYENKEWEDCAYSIEEGKTKDITIGVRALIKEGVANKLFFDLEVLDNLTGIGVSDAEVTIIGKDCGFEFKGQTDEKGWLRVEGEAFCCSFISVRSNNYFLHKSEATFCDIEVGEVRNVLLQPYMRVSEEAVSSRNMASNPLQDTIKVPFKVSEAPEGDDKISYLLNIYYNIGRTSVKKESVTELFRLLTLLKDNPSLIIEIGSHTDSRGSAEFNQNLSFRRASNIVKWLQGEGISKRRLIARGYGEEKPVNDCGDGKDCTEKEYQLNRRTEFRVIGRLD